jgi:2-keto-3-deoxy-L-rhamnonate aldolase RhmA
MTMISEAILHNTQGLSLVIHDPLVVQAVRGTVDFIVLDCAARNCDPSVVSALHNAAGDTPFLVRPQHIQRGTLQNLLNMGVDGLVLTDIHHATELEKIMAACLYPPEGTRPYRPVIPQEKIMLEAINDQITFVIEVAHPQTIAQLEEIAEVTGVNGFLVSPERLAVALEKGGDVTHPVVTNALQTVARVAASYDLPWGIEGEIPGDFTPNFTIPATDMDLFSMGKEAIWGDKKPSLIEEQDDDMPFTLAAYRE